VIKDEVIDLAKGQVVERGSTNIPSTNPWAQPKGETTMREAPDGRFYDPGDPDANADFRGLPSGGPGGESPSEG
jgi:hypothetical protein